MKHKTTIASRIAATIAGMLMMSFAVQARTSELTRDYLNPTRIVWTQGDVTDAGNLLINNKGQATFGNNSICVMKSIEGQTASIVLDYGKELHGGLQIVTGSFHGQKGDKWGKVARVRLRFGESITEAMSDICPETGATNDHAVRDFEALVPWFGFREFGNTGFRFVRIDLLDTDFKFIVKEINAIHEYRDIPQVGSFKCNDDRLNKIWEVGAYTLHQNMQQYIWDGIKRDRLVWIGDMHPEVMGVNSVFGQDDVVNRSLDLARDCAPLPNMMNGMSAYSLWWIIIHKEWYMYQGDREYLLSQRDYLKGLIDVLISKIDENGRDTIKDHFLDWPSRADEKASATGFHALFIMAMEAAEYLCVEMGEEAAAGKCAAARELLRSAAPAVVEEFYAQKIPADQLGRKQAVSLMCLADMITTEKAAPDLLCNGPKGFSTFYGYYMLEALAKCGRYDEAMKIASEFWGGMLDLGATTFWEDFDISWLENAARIDEITPEGKVDVHLSYGGYCYKQLRHSLCHGWASGPTSWMTKQIMGLYPVEKGSRTVMIEPNLGSLKWIEGSLPTPYGAVKVRLEKLSDGRIFAEASAPAEVELKAGKNVILSREGADIDLSQSGIAALRTGFAEVPDSVKTAVYWYWMANNISKEGVVNDLKAMKAAGINRAFIGNQNDRAIPQGGVKFMSDEWWEITHTALKTAAELGIEIGIFNCPGWSQSGGPWVKPEQSMRYVETETVDVKGNGQVQEISLPEFAADQLVSVLAYPALKGQSQTWEVKTVAKQPLETTLKLDRKFTARTLSIVASAQVNCGGELLAGGKSLVKFTFDRRNAKLHVGFKPYAPVIVTIPDTASGEYTLKLDNPVNDNLKVTISELPAIDSYADKSLAKMFQAPLPMWDHYMWETPAEASDRSGYIDPARIRNLTSIVKDGKLVWTVPDGEWTVMTAYMKTTGVTNSPAVEEATGLEVDKMSRKHISTHFDAFLGELLRRIPAEDRATWKVVVEDSYETGGLNWTDDMRPVFMDTYGYDPLPYLPALDGIIVGSADQSDRFLWDLRRLVADRVAYDYVGGLRDISHQHGLETWLENYGHWGFPGEFLMYGGQSDQIGGEYWSEGSLGDIENRAASSCGHIYGKRKIWAESCTSGGPQYHRYPRLMKQRVDRFFCEGINSTLLHFVIQQPDDRLPGLDAPFGNEFNRHNTWYDGLDVFTQYLKRCNLMLQQGRYVADVAYFIGEDAPKMTGVCDPALPEGYSFDYINAEILKQHSHVIDGKLVLDSGMEYRVLVLPRQNTMRPEMLECIASLVEQGLTILGPAPEKSPSLAAYGQADKQVKDLASKVWNASGKYGKGLVYADGTSLEKVFADLGMKPDFIHNAQDARISFIHRTLGAEGDIYYIANQNEAPASFKATFRVRNGLVPELWHPTDGRTDAVACEYKGDCAEISFNLDNLESVFVVFRNSAEKEAVPATRTVTMPVKGTWNVSFAAICGNQGFTRKFTALEDWAKSADNQVRYYSGNATYATTINLNKKQVGSEKVVLDLGEAMVIAKVKVNGKYAGGAWTCPYTVDITDLVKVGSNVVEVIVYNNWKNRLIGDANLPEAERRTWTNINPWKADSELQSSGLLGPVQVKFIQK